MTDPTPTDLSFIREPRRHLSFSQLNVYDSCSEKYRLSYVENAPREPQGAFLGGIAVHETIAQSETVGWWPEEEPFADPSAVAIAYFLRTLHDQVDKNGGEDAIRWGGRGGGETLAWWEKQGEFMLRRYQLTRVGMEAEGWGSVEGGTEMRVIAELPGVSSPVIGYLDKFMMHEGGEPLILDWKAGRVGWVEPMQFATYANLVERARGIRVTRGVVVFLRAPEPAKRVQAVHFEPLIDRMPDVFAKMVAGIEAGIFAPHPSSFCSSCSVRESCWYWRGTRPPEEGETG